MTIHTTDERLPYDEVWLSKRSRQRVADRRKVYHPNLPVMKCGGEARSKHKLTLIVKRRGSGSLLFDGVQMNDARAWHSAPGCRAGQRRQR